MSKNYGEFKLHERLAVKKQIPRSRTMTDAEMAEYEKKQDAQMENINVEIEERLKEANLNSKSKVGVL